MSGNGCGRKKRGEIDQRHVERLLDADDLGAGLLVLVEHLEHPAGELEQALLRVLLGEPDRPVAGLEVSVAFEVGLDVGETRRLALAPGTGRLRRLDPGAEGGRCQHELGLQRQGA